MGILIIPDYVTDTINDKLDRAIAQCPDAAKDRDALYHKLVLYFDEHGEVPDFELTKKETTL